MAVNLTEERVKRASPKNGKTAVLRDMQARGLILRIRPSGTKTYAYQYRTRQGIQRMLTIAPAGSIPLAEARRLVQGYALQVAAGGDPALELKQRTQALTLGQAVDLYSADLARRKVAKAKGITQALHNHALRHLGPSRTLEGITRKELLSVISRLQDTDKPGAARYQRQCLTGLLNWAVNEDHLTASPLAGWQRPKATRAQRLDKPGRALSGPEVAHLWRVCDQAAGAFGDYARLLILLGQRREETARMSWQDIDLAAGVWTIPAHITKNGNEHNVPLPAMALEIVNRQPRRLSNPYVFAGQGSNPIAAISDRMARFRPRAGLEHWTLHDLRRTFRSGLSDLGISQDIAEAMLNHLPPDLIQRYNRSKLWKARREAAESWADQVTQLLDEADEKVVALPRAGRA